MVAQGNTKRSVPTICFRAYDIRGPVDEAHLTPALARDIGLAIGSEARTNGIKQMIVARDGRLSGPELCRELIDGLRASGIDVIFIGIVPTPVLYFATHHLSANSGVMLTASHNPAHHNGFKIVLGSKTLAGDAVQKLYQRICEQDFTQGQGKYTTYDGILDAYVNAICSRIQLQKKLKIVVDCGNGAASVVAKELFEALGCDVVCLYCELDGRFPHHHPDPTVPANLSDLATTVLANDADIGFAFDGDADRLGVMTNDDAEIIWPDRQMMLFCRDILKRYPGAPIIFDVKCSRHLALEIERLGGKPVMWRTGHSLIKHKAAECDAPLAGELSGHIFFRDRWFGFDDGLYVAARILELLSQTAQSAKQLFATLPNSINTPEIKVAIAEENKKDFMQRFIDETDFGAATVITIDGARVEYDDAWALVRPSNTSSCLTLRFEANNPQALQVVQRRTAAQLLAIDASLVLSEMLN